ncbi:Glycosylated lysosomal membrane protein [Apodemus speciosus]|uniref:Glycosylated lysosomal membrane protein n=1 Tax=Apodemus speciosus TaxID=105296 RepID=A0ABQ0EKT0_APOSI
MEVISGWPNPQNLLHIRAVGSNSTLHYVWSSLGPPAVVLVATNTTQSVLSVNWSLLLSPDPTGALTVLPKDSVQFSSALVFTRLLEFDSTKASEGAQPPGKPYPPYSLAKFSWNNITKSLDLATLSTIFQGHPVDDPTGAFANGSLTFKVQAFSRSGRPTQPPRLLHTADVCQLEVALVGASPRGNHSLFGLEVATLGQDPDCPSVNERNSIDDEYAPAVFQLNQLLWGSSPSGFMQWRPVAFSAEERARESALPCQASPLRHALAYSLPHSPIVQAFFGSQNNFCAFNLTFGAPTGPGYWDQYYLSCASGRGFPSSGCFLSTSPRDHGSGPRSSRTHVPGGRPISAAAPQAAFRVPVHKLKPTLQREGQSHICLAVPQTVGGRRVSLQSLIAGLNLLGDSQ